jgi:dTDP-4-amino-4,6-dideoxygalactose transaminase
VVAPYGRAVPLAEWQLFEEKTGIPVVIDAAAGIEAILDGRMPLTGRIPLALSFHATKAFSTGEGGAIACLDPARLTRCAQALNFGFMGTRESTTAGTNGKMSEYHAAVGLAELDGWPAKRDAYRRVAMAYADCARARQLSGNFIAFPSIASNYVLFRANNPEDAEAVRGALDSSHIEHRAWYGTGLHNEGYFSNLICLGALHNAAALGQSLIGLPVFVDLSNDAVERIAATIAKALGYPFK